MGTLPAVLTAYNARLHCRSLKGLAARDCMTRELGVGSHAGPLATLINLHSAGWASEASSSGPQRSALAAMEAPMQATRDTEI